MRVLVHRQSAQFTDSILGNCQYRSFFVGNDLYGGYSYNCEHGFGSADYVDSLEVIKLAREKGFDVHLAGDGNWSRVGHAGYGELVKPDEAERLVKELEKLRGFAIKRP